MIASPCCRAHVNVNVDAHVHVVLSRFITLDAVDPTRLFQVSLRPKLFDQFRIDFEIKRLIAAQRF